MNKELEALRKVKYNSSDEVVQAFDIIEKALQRLEAIDNANPNEALNDLEIIREAMLKYRNKLEEVKVKCIVSPQFASIRQALLKAKEYNDVLKKYNIENIEELEKILKIFFMRGER